MRVSPASIVWKVAAAVVAVAAVAMLQGCSPRKNTAATRKYQEFITRYNIYYNGDKHYKETLDNMEDRYEDDYSSLLRMHPIEAKGQPQTPQPSGNFDRSIEKAQKAIQLRSITKKPAKKPGKASDPAYKEWMKREEYNPFMQNAWMMMGRSQYYNGDFLGAASTFFYTSRHFFWLPATVTEAKLWQARSYLGLDWLFEAEVIIKRIKPDELTNNTLKELYNFDYADLHLRSGQYAEAIPYLREAINYASGSQKTRLWFLLGQLYARTDQKELAYQAFRKAGGAASASYRTKFNARIKQSEVYSGNDIEPEVRALRRMTRYDRNKEYLDQIYYAIGNLYLSRGDTTRAIDNYVLAAEKSTRSGIDKAISQLTLGNLYFQRHLYEKAQPCYSEAVPLLPSTYPDYKMLKRRSDVLDELATYSQNVTMQDSLLRLAELPEAERDAVIARIIEELKKKEKEEAEARAQEEYLANQAAKGNALKPNGNDPAQFNINADNSWYFYNTATRNAGRTEFQRRWGSRKLEDHWRRRNKSTFNTDDFDSSTADDEADNTVAAADTTAAGGELTPEEKQKQERSADPHYPEYYLAQIPFTPEQKAIAHEVIQEGLYNMGVILKDKLEDFPAAMSEFDRLLKNYPDNVYRLDTYYNIYLMYMRRGEKAKAEPYRQLILKEFPDSPTAVAMRDPDYLDNLRAMEARQNELYERTYEAYLANDNEAVHSAYEEVNTTNPSSRILPKFMFLHALAYVTQGRTEEFNGVLREMLDRYPSTDLTPIATAWLKGMAQGRDLHEGTSNMRGMVWDMRLTNDSTAVAAEGPASFDLSPDARQLLIMTFDMAEVPTNQLLYEIARHNFRSFVVRDFDLEQMNFGRLGMIIIRGFDNLDQLNHYRRVMAESDEFRIPAGVRPVVISEENFKKLMEEGRSFEEYFDYLEQQNYVDAQAGLLQPEAVETLREADEAAEEFEATQQPADEVVTEVEVVQPEAAPAQPSAPAESPKSAAAKPSTPTKPAQKPAAKPAANAPAYDPGSEGDDDPLLVP